jgi:hypothetical protein
MADTGATTIDAGALSFTGGSGRDLERTLVNDGTALVPALPVPCCCRATSARASS